MQTTKRRSGLLAVAAVVALAVAGSVLAASPQPPGGPGRSEEAKAGKAPELAKTLTGTVEKGTDGKGRSSYSITTAGTAWQLSAGPPWFWGDNNPFEAFVGKSVTLTGTYHEGETSLTVDTIDGKALRAEGKPPWAGGPKIVGERHPGWKGDDHPGQGQGRGAAPGQLKKASPTP